jgi:serine/threonine-protein kinase
LCAGLAAVHDRGLLHRDLKPANVMLDGRGKVRLTDFGLASEATGPGGAREMAGTPAYMAPELLSGKPATVQSDIYALGLVLYEVFSGKRAFEAPTIAALRHLHESVARPSLSSATGAIDPAIEEVVLRCLDPNPSHRPASAILVAARLPGGDPLAAALAAGETPSPAMVAAAGESDRLAPRTAWACLIGFFVLLAAVAALIAKDGFTRVVPLAYSPDVLANRAQETIARFGYSIKPVDSAYGMYWNTECIDYLGRADKGPARWASIRDGRDAGIVFWYRSSSRYLAPHEYFGNGLANGRVDVDDPSGQDPEQQRVWMSTTGRLIQFEAVPPLVEPPLTSPAPAPQWAMLFDAAGLDAAAYRPTDPTWAPSSWGDARAAWIETHPVRAGSPRRVEAAAWRGKPIFFKIIEPWTPGQTTVASEPSLATRIVQVIVIVVCVAVVVGVALLARFNLARGRGDSRGASRLAVFVCALMMVGWAIEASHVPNFWEVPLTILGFSYALFAAVTVWLLYVALEPFIRRLWPHTIISWSRILSGRFRDPLVGRDLLVGSLGGVIFGLIEWLAFEARVQMGGTPFAIRSALDPLLGSRFVASAAITFFYSAILSTLLLFVVIFALRLVLRRDWLAGGVLVVAATAVSMVGKDVPMFMAVFNVVAMLVFVLLLLRDGLVAVSVANFVAAALASGFPMSMDLSQWYGAGTVPVLLGLSALAIYGFRLSQLGRDPRVAARV